MCGHSGCNAIARWRPEIEVWAAGQNVKTGTGLKLNLDLGVCDNHRDLDPSNFWTDEGKKRVTDGLLQAGERMGRVYAAPDFKTTVITWVPLGKLLT